MRTLMGSIILKCLPHRAEGAQKLDMTTQHANYHTMFFGMLKTLKTVLKK